MRDEQDAAKERTVNIVRDEQDATKERTVNIVREYKHSARHSLQDAYIFFYAAARNKLCILCI